MRSTLSRAAWPALADVDARPYRVLLALLACSLFVPFVFKGNSEWEDVYVRAARSLQQGDSIYDHGNYLYPPFMAFATMPLAGLPEPVRRSVWFAINLWCLVYCLQTAWRLAGGRRSHGSGCAGFGIFGLALGTICIIRYATHDIGRSVPELRWLAPVSQVLCLGLGAALLLVGIRSVRRRSGRWSADEIGNVETHVAYLLGLACGLRFALDCFAHQQTDLCIAAFVLAGCNALRRSHPYRAALFLGLAAGMKCTALLWVGFFLVRRLPRPALLLCLVAVGVNLLPDLFCPASSPRWLLATWVEAYLRPMTQPEYRPGMWGTFALLNQSVAGTVFRWFTTTAWLSSQGFGMGTALNPVAPGLLKLGVYSCSALLLGAAALALRGQSAASPLLSRQTVECCLVVLLMLLLSPMSGKAHFCTLVLPGFVLARIAVGERRRGIAALLVTSILVASVSCQNWGGIGYLVLWCGGLTFAALLLFSACASLLISRRAPGPAS